MARIQIIPHEESSGDLRAIYDDLLSSRGKLANIHMIHSLSPKSMTAHMDLYMTVMFNKSPLKRYQREMMAVVVSRANSCMYCQKHHAEALQFYWKDEERVESFRLDYTDIELSDVDGYLCDYAHWLTKDPANSRIPVLIDALKKSDLSDRAILDATLVISYFNFVNRIVLGLDVEEEQDVGGYNY
jgi:uncharacterized peroxidase-related enzyme